MLVHTAVPVKFSENVVLNSQNFTVVGGSTHKKRRIRELNLEEFEESAGKPIVSCRFILKDFHNEDAAVSESFEIEDKVQYVVVSKKESSITKEPDEDRHVSLCKDVELIEEEDKHSTSRAEEQPTISAQEQLEGYSEFIFSGEKYVQMPKRIFDAEKQKLTDEIEKYKNMLKKMKLFLNKVDCWWFKNNKFCA